MYIYLILTKLLKHTKGGKKIKYKVIFRRTIMSRLVSSLSADQIRSINDAIKYVDVSSVIKSSDLIIKAIDGKLIGTAVVW
jgi:hypothetical protein